MAYPASVNQVELTRLKGGQSRPRRKNHSGKEDPSDFSEPAAAVGVGGPVLDIGRLGGTRLERNVGSGRSWYWKWIEEEINDLKLFASDPAQLLFPSTRYQQHRFPAQSLQVMIKSALDYVEEYVDLSQHDSVQDLIKAELVASYLRPGKQVYDPYQDKTLATIQMPKARYAKTLVCFPMGELGHCLNVSPLIDMKQEPLGQIGTFQPSAKAVMRFPTAILQIASSPVTSTQRYDGGTAMVLVRLQSSTRLLSITPNPDFVPASATQAVHAFEVASIITSQTEGRRHVDAAFDPLSPSRALIIDQGGGLWLWWKDKIEVHERLIKACRLEKVRDAVTTDEDQFFRVAFGTRPGTALVMSARSLSVIDLAHPDQPETTLLELRGKDRMFTSLERSAAARGARYTCLCTTFEVMWIDECESGPPRVSWTHEYGGGKKRDLSLTYIEDEDRECIFLASRSDPLILVYHVSSTPPIRSLCPPYSLVMPFDRHHLPLVSVASIKLSANSSSRRAATILLGLDTNAALWSFPVKSFENPVPDDETERTRQTKAHSKQDLRVRWSADIETLANDAEERNEVNGKAKSKYQEMDFRWAWLVANDSPDTISDAAFSIQGFEQHLREHEAPFEHLLTLSDLARDTVQNSGGMIRCSLLKSLPLDSSLSYYDSLEYLTKLDVSRYLSVVTGLEVLTTPANLSGHARNRANTAFGIFEHLQRSFSLSRSRDRLNAQRLAVELALSSIVVFSEDVAAKSSISNPARASGSAEDDFARATGLLSLQDSGPPLIEICFLHPHKRVSSTSPHSPERVSSPTDLEDHRLQGVTARTLMAEWKIGSDPRKYEWKGSRKDPRGETGISVTPHFKSLPSPQTPLTKPAQSQGAESMPLPMPHARSSPPPVRVGNIVNVIQEANTQVERGPYGGRPAPAVKKKLKKRVGGF